MIYILTLDNDKMYSDNQVYKIAISTDKNKLGRMIAPLKKWQKEVWEWGESWEYNPETFPKKPYSMLELDIDDRGNGQHDYEINSAKEWIFEIKGYETI